MPGYPSLVMVLIADATDLLSELVTNPVFVPNSRNHSHREIHNIFGNPFLKSTFSPTINYLVSVGESKRTISHEAVGFEMESHNF